MEITISLVPLLTINNAGSHHEFSFFVLIVSSMIDFIKEDNKNAPAVIDNNRTTVRDALQSCFTENG